MPELRDTDRPTMSGYTVLQNHLLSNTLPTLKAHMTTTTTFISPFSRYLNTNYVPSSLDRSQILDLLREREAELARLTEDMAGLHAKLHEVKAQHDGLERIIFEHYQLLSSFRRLPDDILQEIFLQCLPETHNALMSPREAPLLLGRVCSRWRTIALHTPRLWATLHIPFHVPPTPNIGQSYSTSTHMFQELCEDFEERFKLHCDAVHDWLTRSGSCPLSISLNPSDGSLPPKGRDYVGTYLNILLNFSHRWRSLEFTIRSKSHSAILASVSIDDLPMLKYLHLRFGSRRPLSVVRNDNWLKSGLLSAKSLRTLKLYQFPFPLSSVEGDFSRVTHLTLSEKSKQRTLSIEEAYKIFSRSKSLVHCALNVIDSALSSQFIPTETISLPHLESLSIVDGAQELGTLIECLDVPSLRDITFHTTFSPCITRRSPLVTLLARTYGHVRSLTTDVQFFTHSDLVECLELTPSLTHFVNKRSHMTPSIEQTRLLNSLPSNLKIMKSVLELFLPNTFDDTCLCRQLQTLELKDSLSLTEHDVLAFIKEKMEAFKSSTFPIALLKKAKIRFSHIPKIDLKVALKDYVAIEDGLELKIEHPSPKKLTAGNFNASNGLIKHVSGPHIFW